MKRDTLASSPEPYKPRIKSTDTKPTPAFYMTRNSKEQKKKHKNKNIFHFSCKKLARIKLLIYLCNVKRKRPHRLTLKTFGEVAEWSIAPVLKTGVLRGTGGSNPSLSAEINLQDIDFQPCRFFLCPKNAPKMHRTSPLRTPTGVFKSNISHNSHPRTHYIIR